METKDIELAEITFPEASLCYQCAKCSAGCPVSEEMDKYPHQIIHLVSLGLEDQILDKDTIWICANCYACAVKCPNDINITSIMNELKEKAVAKGIKPKYPEIYQFHKSFANDVFNRGRAHEMKIMIEYNLRIKKPFKNAGLAPKMFMKNKLQIMPPKTIPGFKKWIKQVSERNEK